MLIPFVARAGVLAEVDSALAAARAGRGTLLTVTGEPGIGKTRLAEEAAGRAEGFEVGLLDGEQISLLEEERSALPDGQGPLIALVTARMSIASTLLLPEAQRLELATEAVRRARSAGDDAALAAALAALCDAIAGPDHCAARRAHATEIPLPGSRSPGGSSWPRRAGPRTPVRSWRRWSRFCPRWPGIRSGCPRWRRSPRSSR